MDQTVLSLTVRYVGVALAVVATFLASPSGSKRLGLAVISLLRWLVPRRRNQMAGVQVSGSGEGTVSVSGTAMFSAGAKLSMGQRVDVLQEEMAEVKKKQAEDETRFNELSNGLADVRQSTTTIQQTVTTHERANDAVDAGALPSVGVGILLSALPDQLVVPHRWADIVLLAVAVAAVVWYFASRIILRRELAV